MGRKIKNLVGKQFGHLTAVEFAGLNKHKQAMWKCNCDCGNEIITCGGDLTSGRATSCGCSRAKANIGKTAKMKFVGDEMRLLMERLLEDGLRQHPKIPEFWATPDGQVYVIRENHIIQPSYSLGKRGYYTFGAAVCGNKTKNYRVHRIIAETFLVNNIGPDAFVNHINETKTDNRVSNLEFCTPTYNVNWSHAKSVRAFDMTTGEWIGDFLNIDKAAQYFRCSRTAVGHHMKCVKRNVRFEFIDNYLKSAQRDYLKENERHDLKYDDIDKTITDF